MNIIKNPKVSIIIPVYNGADYMREAIDSALLQTYSNCEVIVVNDGSNDDGRTDGIALSYGERIRYIHKENGGVASALNMGLREMTGEYFSWLSHDDVFLPEKTAVQIELLNRINSPDAILYGGYYLINEKSKIMGVWDPNMQYSADKLSISLFPVFRGLANGCTMLIHRSHFERIGNFDESLLTTQDYALWFKMFRHANVVCCKNILVKSRVHGEQGSKKIPGHVEECENLWIRMVNELSEEEMCSMAGSPYHFYKETARFLERHSNYSQAIKFLKHHIDEENNMDVGLNRSEAKILKQKFLFMIKNPVIIFRQVYYKIKCDGFISTLKKIIYTLKMM